MDDISGVLLVVRIVFVLLQTINQNLCFVFIAVNWRKLAAIRSLTLDKHAFSDTQLRGITVYHPHNSETTSVAEWHAPE